MGLKLVRFIARSSSRFPRGGSWASSPSPAGSKASSISLSSRVSSAPLH